jgi:large-conductance mechanosensitive channel
MAQIAISSLFATFIHILTAIVGLFLLQDFEDKVRIQTEVLSRNKTILTICVFLIVGFINSLIQYEKYLERKEQRRKLKPENDKLENENNKNNTRTDRGN